MLKNEIEIPIDIGRFLTPNLRVTKILFSVLGFGISFFFKNRQHNNIKSIIYKIVHLCHIYIANQRSALRPFFRPRLYRHHLHADQLKIGHHKHTQQHHEQQHAPQYRHHLRRVHADVEHIGGPVVRLRSFHSESLKLLRAHGARRRFVRRLLAVRRQCTAQLLTERLQLAVQLSAVCARNANHRNEEHDCWQNDVPWIGEHAAKQTHKY